MQTLSFCFKRYFPLTTDQQQPQQIILTTSEAVDLHHHHQPHSDLALVHQQHQSSDKTVVVMGPLESTAVAAAPDGSQDEEVLMSFSINDPSMTPADHSS